MTDLGTPPRDAETPQPLDLDAIKAWLKAARQQRPIDWPIGRLIELVEHDVPAIIAEVERLRAVLDAGSAPQSTFEEMRAFALENLVQDMDVDDLANFGLEVLRRHHAAMLTVARTNSIPALRGATTHD